MNINLRPFIVVAMLFLSAYISFAQNDDQLTIPSHHIEGGFKNTDPDFEEAAFTKVFARSVSNLGSFLSKPVGDIPHIYNDGSIFKQNKPYTVTWIGHSTSFIQLEGLNILTDPVWSDRIGPVSWAGDLRAIAPELLSTNCRK